VVVVGQWGSRAALGQAVPMMPRGATRGLLLALLCGPVSAATMMWDLVPFVSDQTIEMKVNGDSLSGIAEEYVAVRRIDTGFSLCPPPPVCVYYAGNASVALFRHRGQGAAVAHGVAPCAGPVTGTGITALRQIWFQIRGLVSPQIWPPRLE
jgi:hypothetical protein